MTNESKEIILICLLGTSPAVLTETVWALAQKGIVPHKIEIWSTSTGYNSFQKNVMAPGVWAKLKNTLKNNAKLKKTLKVEGIKIDGRLTLGPLSTKYFPDSDENPLADLDTEEANLLAADAMLNNLLSYSRREDTQIILSISGGRKTMSALALQCIALVGREQDVVYHALVKDDFTRPLDPPFFYPEGKTREMKDAKGNVIKKVKDKDAGLTLFKVPYVRVYPLYKEKIGDSVVSFKELCGYIQKKIDQKLEIVVDMSLDSDKDGLVKINNRPFDVKTSMVLLWLLWKKKYYTRGELETALKKILAKYKNNLDKYKNQYNINGWLKSFFENTSHNFEQKQEMSQAIGRVKDLLKEGFGGQENINEYFPYKFNEPKRIKELDDIQWENVEEAEACLNAALEDDL